MRTSGDQDGIIRLCMRGVGDRWRSTDARKLVPGDKRPGARRVAGAGRFVHGLIALVLVLGVASGVVHPTPAPSSAPSHGAVRAPSHLALASSTGGPGWALGSLGNLFSPDISVLPNSVTCVSTSDCWSVGDTSSAAAGTNALALHWDGTWWSQSSLPSLGVASSELTSVNCVSSSDCWATGESNVDSPTSGQQVIMLNWDGSSWSQVSTPNPVAGTIQFYGIPAVSCADANDCWTVGSWASTTPEDFVLQWDGSSWTVGSIPGATAPYDGSTLGAVTCTSASSCWAVGTETSSSGSPAPQAFVTQWNGAAWSASSMPTAPGLSSVSCTSSSACWAAGPNSATSAAGDLLRGTDRVGRPSLSLG